MNMTDTPGCYRLSTLHNLLPWRYTAFHLCINVCRATKPQWL